ncbi:MAG: type I restriction enzyme HsdR N-terminal domain-containing protein [Chlamydiota bacterium]
MTSPKKLYDPIREFWVAATPEEVVRQRCLQKMLQLGYPKRWIVVEASLHPSLGEQSLAIGRRVDILALYLKGSSLAPLLLIECKASTSCSPAALQQVMGYNSIGAPFLALAGSEYFSLRWKEQTGEKELFYLPKYQELVNACMH